MSLDRRSFRFGILAGITVVIAIVAAFVYLPQHYSSTSNDVQAATTAPASVTSVGLPNEGFTAVVKEAMPAVVNISTTRVVKSQGDGSPFMNDPFFKQFFGDQFSHQFQVPKSRRESALGSGVIVDKRGYIITNNHVIAKADEIKVVLNDKREFKAKLIGTDPKTDVAVIKIDAKNLPALPWGNSDNLQVGEYVLAIGNPFGLSQTVTMGIVSATGRANVGIADYEDFIQTDAAINPGNSGGALVNARGQLVGMNTAIFSRSGGYMGIGFAVPSNMAHKVMESLIKNGKVTRGWLGVSIQPLDEQLAKHFGLKAPNGVLVNEVMSDTPAAKGGVKEGDIIISFDGKDTPDPTTLRNIVAETAVGKHVEMKVIRNGSTKNLSIKVAEQPKNLTVSEKQPESENDNGKILKGVEVQNMNEQIAQQLGLPKMTAGVVVTDVEVGSPAERAGLMTGDVILQVNNKGVSNIDDFRKAVISANKKRGLLLLINRRGQKEFLGISP